MAPIDKHLPQPPEKAQALEEAKETDRGGKGDAEDAGGNCWSDALLACLVECCPCSTCPAKCFNYKNEISQTCSQSGTLSQRAFSYPHSNCHPFWLSFNAKLCETRGSCSSSSCSSSGPTTALASHSARAGSMCCAYANVFPYPWPYQQTQRCLSNARQFKCANEGKEEEERKGWEGKGSSEAWVLSKQEPRATSQVPFGIYSFMRCTFAFAAIKRCR